MSSRFRVNPGWLFSLNAFELWFTHTDINAIEIIKIGVKNSQKCLLKLLIHLFL